MTTKAFNVVEDGDDLYVEKDAHASTREKVCTNLGCGQKYSDVSNRSDACWYHPGNPVFHEGRKGWQCCPKRVDDFDEAMSLPGCTLGSHHSDMPALKAQVIRNKPLDPKYLPKSSVDGVETFSVPGAPSVASRSSTSSLASSVPVQIVEEPDDPLDAAIDVGTKCRHNGCKDPFIDDSSRTEPCVYHPGLAVFHEGSKYWTCCKPRCAEFEEFLKIEGCKVGRHKFCPKAGEGEDPLQVKCRYDFYQQGDYIYASIYGKNMDKTTSTITCKPQTLEVRIEFKDGKHFHKNIPLFGEIDITLSSHEFLTTKAEIKLVKATPIVWDSLEPADPNLPQ